MRRLVDDHRFAFADLLLILSCGAVGVLWPELAFWSLLLAGLPWVIRILAGRRAFRSTRFDLAVLIFLFTAGVSSSVAYNPETAAAKLFFILIAVLLYFSLVNQPRRNLPRVGRLFFAVGIGVCLYYLFSRDYGQNPSGIPWVDSLGTAWSRAWPGWTWPLIPSGYVPGVALVTSAFGFVFGPKQIHAARWPARLFHLAGWVVIVVAILITRSTSVWVAGFAVVGVWLLWKLVAASGLPPASWFPRLLLLYLATVVLAVLFFDPSASASSSQFGTNSRPEVFGRAAYFLQDYPLSGGGLAAFPGLYSEYVLGIPYFYFANSYNLFLDVAIEQGWLAGCVLLFMYTAGIFRVSYQAASQPVQRSAWVALFVLVFAAVHGLTQDYLYYAAGTMLLFFPIAMSVCLARRAGAGPPIETSGLATGQRPLIGVLLLSFIVGLALNARQIGSLWYSNLGAVQLAQVELAGFPRAGWLGAEVIPQLQGAERSLRRAVQLDPGNLTANYRLGLIYLLNRDYASAIRYLELAFAQAPEHRGIQKWLGYAYLWHGETGPAQDLLTAMPEVIGELDAYYFWWQAQDRPDLSAHAYMLRSRLEPALGQP